MPCEKATQRVVSIFFVLMKRKFFFKTKIVVIWCQSLSSVYWKFCVKPSLNIVIILLHLFFAHSNTNISLSNEILWKIGDEYWNIEAWFLRPHHGIYLHNTWTVASHILVFICACFISWLLLLLLSTFLFFLNTYLPCSLYIPRDRER